MVEYGPILSINIVSHFQSYTFGHYYRTLQRGLCAIAELLVCMGVTTVQRDCVVLLAVTMQCNADWHENN